MNEIDIQQFLLEIKDFPYLISTTENKWTKISKLQSLTLLTLDTRGLSRKIIAYLDRYVTKNSSIKVHAFSSGIEVIISYQSKKDNNFDIRLIGSFQAIKSKVVRDSFLAVAIESRQLILTDNLEFFIPTQVDSILLDYIINEEGKDSLESYLKMNKFNLTKPQLNELYRKATVYITNKLEEYTYDNLNLGQNVFTSFYIEQKILNTHYQNLEQKLVNDIPDLKARISHLESETKSIKTSFERFGLKYNLKRVLKKLRLISN